MTLTIISVKGL